MSRIPFRCFSTIRSTTRRRKEERISRRSGSGQGDFLNWLFAQEQYRDSTVLVTTHGAAMAGLLNNLKKKPLAEYWGVGVHKNCGVTEVDVTDGRIDIISENKVYYTDVVKPW